MSDELGAMAEAAPMPEAPAIAPEAAPPQAAPEAKAHEPKPDKAAPKEHKSLRDIIRDAKEKTEPAPDKKDAVPARDDQGRFKAAEDAATKPANEPAAPAQKPAVPEAKTPEPPKPVHDAPARFSPDAKAAWANVPDAVKAEVRRAIGEMETGLGEYQKRFEKLKPFDERAKREGTTVEAALQNYIGLAEGLRSTDPRQQMETITRIFEFIGTTPQKFAAWITGQKPDQVQAQNDSTIAALRREIAELKQGFGAIKTDMQSREEQAVQEHINQFAKDKPRFQELRGTMSQLIQGGIAQDLQDAYEMAERLNPAAQPAAPPPPAAKPQPQPAANLSISGAPRTGSNPAQPKPVTSIRDAIRRAQSRVG